METKELRAELQGALDAIELFESKMLKSIELAEMMNIKTFEDAEDVGVTLVVDKIDNVLTRIR